jgi:hypothetical protein
LSESYRPSPGHLGNAGLGLAALAGRRGDAMHCVAFLFFSGRNVKMTNRAEIGANVEIKGPFGSGLRKLVGKRGVIDDIACDYAGLVYRIALLVPVMALGRELKTIDMHRIGFRVLK